MLICRDSDVVISKLDSIPGFMYLSWPEGSVLAEGDTRDELQTNIALELGGDHFQQSVMNKLVITSGELVSMFEAWCDNMDIGRPLVFAYIIVEKQNLSMVMDLLEVYHNNQERKEEDSEEMC